MRERVRGPVRSGIDRRDLLQGIGAGAAALSLTAAAKAAGLTDIVDAQVHIGRGGIEPALASMNALGIKAALLYEYWGPNPSGDPRHGLPGSLMPNGAWRNANIVAAEAAIAYPDRFATVVKIDRRDPELEAWLKVLRSSPHVKGVRLLPVWNGEDRADFAAGGFDPFFALAEKIGLPVFLFIPGDVALLAPYARRFPRLTMIVDHSGMPFANISPQASLVRGADYFREVLDLARHPNVCLKWSHASHLFGPDATQADKLAPYLRQAVDAFGPERVMWASDNTVIPDRSWSELLDATLVHSDLSAPELEWVMGRTVRERLGWSGPAT